MSSSQPSAPSKAERWLVHEVAQATAPRISHDIKNGHTPVASEEFHPVIQEFQRVIEEDPILYSGFHQMFEQVPNEPLYEKDPNGDPQVHVSFTMCDLALTSLKVCDYITMLTRINRIIKQAPAWEDGDFVALPINVMLEWPMGTPAGFQTLTNPKVNAQFKALFDVWASFLSSPESRYVLNTDEDGWFGRRAFRAMPNFIETFVCDPYAPYYGFKSWDDFFVREIRPGKRPVSSLDDDAIVTSACESTIYCIAPDVKERDQFWLKGQPYSLVHMMDNDEFVPQFVGGTVYQAYLSQTMYHRWHSPVTGTIVRHFNVSGSYFAECPTIGMDPLGQCGSQRFITQTSARAIIYIRADNPDIGLMCFMGVGMAECSTCEVTVKEGDRVTKGDQLGMFHFGGSTYCLIFRPETKLKFLPTAEIGAAILLNQAIASVTH